MDSDTLKMEIRARLPLVELLEKCGVMMKRVGSRMVACCPFHAEKSASFGVDKARPDFAHCFGCGWSGDVFQFFMEQQGCDFKEALNSLADMTGLPRLDNNARVMPLKKVVQKEVAPAAIVMPDMPPLRGLRAHEIEQIAKTRGLSREAVHYASWDLKMIGYAMWPKWKNRQGNWVSTCKAHFFNCGMNTPQCEPRESWPSWIITDATRRVGEFRRLDNLPYPKQKHDAIKAWSTAGKSWPVGAEAIGDKENVLMVEGGPDVLAAIHFLLGFGMLREVAVVGMLGGGNHIADDALPLFKGKRVRSMIDADEVKEQLVKKRDGTTKVRRSRAGYDSGLRWQNTLLAAGASFEAFNLWGLTRADGRAVKDVNDLALCNSETLGRDEIMEAFTAWNF